MLYSYPYLRMLLLSFVKLKCVNYNVLPSRTRTHTHLVINILLMSLKANLICVLVIPLKWRILHRSLEWFEVPNSTSFRNFKGHMPGGWSGIFGAPLILVKLKFQDCMPLWEITNIISSWTSKMSFARTSSLFYLASKCFCLISWFSLRR